MINRIDYIHREGTYIKELEDKLMPCPFCQYDAEIVTYLEDKDLKTGQFYAQCKMCKNRTDSWWNPFDAYGSWNRRYSTKRKKMKLKKKEDDDDYEYERLKDILP